MTVALLCDCTLDLGEVGKITDRSYRPCAGQNTADANMGLHQRRLRGEERNGVCPTVFRAIMSPDVVLQGCVFPLLTVIIQMYVCHYR